MFRKSLQKITGACQEAFVICSKDFGDKLVFWRGTRGDGAFSNPYSLKEKGGFWSRGKSSDIAYHRFAANDTIYIPTSNHEGAACRFIGFYGWMHVMQRPAIYVNVPKIHEILPKFPCASDSDDTVDSAIASEGEHAAVEYLPWSDIILSRQTVGMPWFPSFSVYVGEAVHNKDFKPRNFSCEILSVDPEQAEKFTPVLGLADCERPLSFDEAKQICEVLTAEASNYKLHINSEEFIVSSVKKDKPFTQSLKLITEGYHALTSAKHEKTNVLFKVGLFRTNNEPKSKEEMDAEIVWKNVLKIK